MNGVDTTHVCCSSLATDAFQLVSMATARVTMLTCVRKRSCDVK